MALEAIESCLLIQGLKSSDCAAWVQAWGSIIAILAAAGIASAQHTTQVRREKRITAERATRYNVTAATLLVNLRTTITSIRKQVEVLGPLESHSVALSIKLIEETRAPITTFPIWAMEDINISVALLKAGEYASVFLLVLNDRKADLKAACVHIELKLDELILAIESRHAASNPGRSLKKKA